MKKGYIVLFLVSLFFICLTIESVVKSNNKRIVEIERIKAQQPTTDKGQNEIERK